MRKFLSAFAVAAACVFPAAAQAQVDRTFSLNFNDVAPGTSVNTQYQALTGATFSLVGNPAGVVVADNPGFPANPSPALNAITSGDGSSIRYTDFFNYYIRTFSFTVVVDPLGFGVNNAQVFFLNRDNSIFDTLTIDQTVTGNYTYVAPNSGGPISVVLPGDAFYDNVSTSLSAPEPATLGLLAGGLAVGGLRARRRRK